MVGLFLFVSAIIAIKALFDTQLLKLSHKAKNGLILQPLQKRL